MAIIRTRGEDLPTLTLERTSDLTFGRIVCRSHMMPFGALTQSFMLGLAKGPSCNNVAPRRIIKN